METCEVTHQLQARIRNQGVRAMVVIAAARRAQVSGPGSDDNHFSVPAGQQDSLQVGHGGGKGVLLVFSNPVPR